MFKTLYITENVIFSKCPCNVYQNGLYSILHTKFPCTPKIKKHYRQATNHSAIKLETIDVRE